MKAPRHGGASEDLLLGGELSRRATGGALLLGARGALILVLGMGANIVLARLLVPRDFGLVALGTVLITFGGYLADGGLGAALIRRPEPPTRTQLEAVNGVQLATAVALALAFAAGSIPFGRDGIVAAAMVATIPITILRTPSTIVLERQIQYRTIATVDVVEALSFYTWAVATVALGMGVWGIATAVAVRALAGTAVMIRMGPIGLVRPRWSWMEVRPLLGFGVKVQSVTVVAILRDQGLNVIVAALAGVATLGVWNLAWRVLQVPMVLLATLARIAYPAMARLLAAGEDPGPALERGLAIAAVATALVVVPIVGFAPALPTLVGTVWDDVPETLLWSSLGMLLGGPIYVVIVGYLYAADRAGTVVRLTLLQTVCMFAVAVPLLPTIGAPALGLASVAGSVVNLVVLPRGPIRDTGAAVARSLGVTTAVATVAGASAWAIASAGSATLLRGVVGAVAGELVLLGALALVRRSLLRDTYVLLLRSATGRVSRRAEIQA